MPTKNASTLIPFLDLIQLVCGPDHFTTKEAIAIGSKVSISPEHVGRLLNNMVGKDFVAKGNLRGLYVYLTPDGKKYDPSAAQIEHEHNADRLSMFLALGGEQPFPNLLSGMRAMTNAMVLTRRELRILDECPDRNFIVRALRGGCNILVVGPRLSGKTQVMYELLENLSPRQRVASVEHGRGLLASSANSFSAIKEFSIDACNSNAFMVMHDAYIAAIPPATLLIDGFDDPQGIAYLTTDLGRPDRGLQFLASVEALGVDDGLSKLVELHAWRDDSKASRNMVRSRLLGIFDVVLVLGGDQANLDGRYVSCMVSRRYLGGGALPPPRVRADELSPKRAEKWFSKAVSRQGNLSAVAAS